LAGPERIALRIPRDTYYLSLVRGAVVELATRAGFRPVATAEIEMAVDEACSNAIRHARPGAAPDEGGDAISLDALADASGLTVTVSDRGAPFAFDNCGAGDIDSYLAGHKPGGLGVYIIKRFMDEVEYRHRPEVGNELRMRKYLVAAREGRAQAGRECPTSSS
jgi:anti-sigma regulatory factor (Ser/Thr protein kinase)